MTTPTTPTTPTTGTDLRTDPGERLLGRARVDSPVGELTIVASANGLRAVLWPVEGDADRVGLDDLDGVDAAPSGAVADLLRRAAEQLAEYFAGDRRDFDLPLDPEGTEFQRAAWTALRTIDFGSTISYGEQADRMGDRNKARAVGAANGRNPISIIVPCHRVVGSDGALTGFAGGVDTKRWLLDHEARVSGARLV